MTARSSLPVYPEELAVIDAGSAAAGVEQFLEPEQVEIFHPGFWAVEILVEIGLNAVFRALSYLPCVSVEMSEKWLVLTVALVRRRAERHLDHGVDRDERDLRLIRVAADLLIRDDPLGRQDHAVRRHREIDIHKRQSVDLCIAISIAALNVDQCDIRVQCRDQNQLLAGERAIDLLRIR